MIAVDGESLGLELACPHCAKTVPVPWEDIAVEEQGQAKAAAPAAAPSLIAQVEPARSYDFSRFHQLANALPELCAYTAVSKWKQVAKDEQNRIKEAFQTIDDALQQFVEAIAKLSLDLDRAKSDFKQQSFLKRISGDHRKEGEIKAQIADIEKTEGVRPSGKISPWRNVLSIATATRFCREIRAQITGRKGPLDQKTAPREKGDCS